VGGIEIRVAGLPHRFRRNAAANPQNPIAIPIRTIDFFGSSLIFALIGISAASGGATHRSLLKVAPFLLEARQNPIWHENEKANRPAKSIEQNPNWPNARKTS
jgi:hypothetical protein